MLFAARDGDGAEGDVGIFGHGRPAVRVIIICDLEIGVEDYIAWFCACGVDLLLRGYDSCATVETESCGSGGQGAG